MIQQQYNGVCPDERSKVDKAKDYQHDELFGSQSVEWLTKSQATKSEELFPIRDQKNTSSCLCYAVCTALYSTEKENLSPGFLYSQRINKPQEGSIYYDIAGLVKDYGVPSETSLPTPTTESKINALKISDQVKTEAKKHTQKAYIFMYEPTIETLASLSNQGIPVVISIFGNYNEWSSDYPIVQDPSLNPSNAPINHAITVLPYSGFKYSGIEHIKIQDSAHFGGLVFRDLNKSWVTKRVKHAMYFIDMEFEDSDFPDHLRGYTWNKDLYIGTRGQEVQRLQEFLRYKGFFPKTINGVPFECTQYFGGITRKAVIEYQTSKGIKPNVGYFGPLTRTEANKETF